jgi:alkylhydroperoxidase family enzyme
MQPTMCTSRPEEFDEAELTKLTLAITQINAWNRIAIAFRAEPGSYQPAANRPAQAHRKE